MSDLVSVLRRHWIIIVATVLVVVMASFFSTGEFSDEQVYSAVAEFMLVDGVASDAQSFLPMASSRHSDRDLRQRATMALSDDIATRVIERLDLDESTAELGGRVSIREDLGYGTVKLTARHTDPQMAADIANAYLEAYSQYALEMQDASLQSVEESLLALAEETKDGLEWIEVPADIRQDGVVYDVTLGDGAYESLLNYIGRIRIARETQQAPVLILSLATPAAASEGLGAALTLAVAIVAGLVLGVMLALFAEYMNRRRGARGSDQS